MHTTFKRWMERQLAGEETSLDIPKNIQDMDGLTLENAMRVHVAWRLNLDKFIKSGEAAEVNVEEISADDLCIVGRWIYGSGKKFADLDEYKRFQVIHAKFHRCSGEIIQYYQQKRFTDVTLKIRNELNPTLNEFAEGIIDLCLAINDTREKANDRQERSQKRRPQ